MKAQDSDRTERIGTGIAMAVFESLGFAFREQSESDYGIDAHAELIVTEKPTGQLLGLQLKSGPSYLSETCNDGYVFRTDKKHVDYWLKHALPVLICLGDVDTKTIYWQVVNSDTAVSTGKGFKFTVPTTQTIGPASKTALASLLTPVVATDRYTIFKTDDTSHGAAKRYSFEVVLNGSVSKAEVAAIVRQVTDEGQKRRYHRNHMVEGQWGDTDAYVVWTYIYPSAEDHSRRNHVCRSIWIHDSLAPEFRPMGFDGENVGDNIIVDWSDKYDFLTEHVSTHTLSKEAYFSEVLPRIYELKSALTTIEANLLALANSDSQETDFLAATEAERSRINEIYFEITDLPYAPFECRDMDTKLESFVAFLHNIWLFYSDEGRTSWDEQSRLEQSLQQRSYACETLRHLEYELSKAR
ncbi:hypothetical protein Pla110_24880 [Polystyrenella longa]|uniref:DUF4365 domain-containing protein n=1 Tax=Polystyrenella longa TaxID=2528007 RepID=A0A518CNE9_9PLAN|nr:DUF4365 domain-containing protein [Polystyrenella longa]QDU80755.1 hypothetical protein Pla110_24880 [Polystyrenella longa]